MKFISCAFGLIWILANLTCPSSSRPFDATLSRRSNVLSSSEAPPRPWSLPEFPWKSKTLTKEEPPSPPLPAKNGRKMLLEAVLEGVLASEMTAMLASLLDVDPTSIIFAANVVVNAFWQTADRGLKRFMRRHFILRSDDFENNRVHTVLLSGFSHQSETHLSSNMAALLLFGPRLSKLMGRSYAYFYVASIYASDLFDQIVYSPTFQPTRNKARVLFWEIDLPSGSLGASGAISALLAYFCLEYPMEGLNMTEVSDLTATILDHNETATSQDATSPKKEDLIIPSWIFGALSLLSDLIPTKGSNIGHGAHLGGYIFGASLFLLSRLWSHFRDPKAKRRRRYRRRRQRFRSRLHRLGSAGSKLGRFLREKAADLWDFLESELEDELNSHKSSSQHHKSNTPPEWDFHERLEKLFDELESDSKWNKESGFREMVGRDKKDEDAPDAFRPRPPEWAFHERLEKLFDELESDSKRNKESKA